MSGCRSEAGRLFQILGPATEKLLSPSRVVCSRNSEDVGVSGTKLGASEVRDQVAVSTRYDGSWRLSRCPPVFQLVSLDVCIFWNLTRTPSSCDYGRALFCRL